MTSLVYCSRCFSNRERCLFWLRNEITLYKRSLCQKNISSADNETSKKLKPPWRIMFFGSDSFAVKSLASLCSKLRTGTIIKTLDVTTTFVIDSKGKNPIYKFANSEKLTLHKWPTSCDYLRDKYDLGIVVSFGHLIPNEVIQAFPLGVLNVHASLLPRWRGAAPIIRAIMNGDTETGITIIKISPKFDTGDILRQYSVPIFSQETAEELTNRLAELGARLLIECIRYLPKSVESAIPQSNENVTYAKKVSKNTAIVKWNEQSAEEIVNLHRALNHIYPLTTTWFNYSVKLLHVRLDEINDFNPMNKIAIEKLNLQHQVIPGLVEFSRKRSVIRVQCKDGRWICVGKIIIPDKVGKTNFTAIEFYNGYINQIKNPLDRKFNS